MRQRILARLMMITEMTDTFQQLPAIGAMAAELGKLFQQQWPDVEALPVYPVFEP